MWAAVLACLLVASPASLGEDASLGGDADGASVDAPERSPGPGSSSSASFEAPAVRPAMVVRLGLPAAPPDLAPPVPRRDVRRDLRRVHAVVHLPRPSPDDPSAA